MKKKKLIKSNEKKQSLKLKDIMEGFLGIGGHAVIGGNPFGERKKDNFTFKGLPGHFDEDGNKIGEKKEVKEDFEYSRQNIKIANSILNQMDNIIKDLKRARGKIVKISKSSASEIEEIIEAIEDFQMNLSVYMDEAE